jgi:hypothetical protein
MIDIHTPPLATQVILEAYLQVLADAEQRQAGALGDNAIERYAAYLVSLQLSADISERRSALTQANEHGLDMHQAAVVAAERTIGTAFEVCLNHFLVSFMCANSGLSTYLNRKDHFPLSSPCRSLWERQSCSCCARSNGQHSAKKHIRPHSNRRTLFCGTSSVSLHATPVICTSI